MAAKRKPHLGPIMVSERFKAQEYANTPQLRDVNFPVYTKAYRQLRQMSAVDLGMWEKALRDVKQGLEAASYEQLLTGVR